MLLNDYHYAFRLLADLADTLESGDESTGKMRKTVTDTTDLIKRARELAAPADEATPGPWELCGTRGLDLAEGVTNNGVYVEYGRVYTTQPDRDAELIAAAPEMAEMLRQLADALEEVTS
jgi:hypothetical protein